ncbi:hypothetical protein CDO26_05850 [Sinorhizobium meliloti]|uniref:hypothetical protein n=1 Tax=Rhizobium meliloti TaxID=382 RepID=UPI000B49A704|nr:hypothetical protein [Sinorhizobium meliloti]ASP84173.1 hypothetical protein CDO26_05850 [Sinorhizobium meliloti]MQW24973.1 hypothetical protein [Sinorhizobium meliloti]
MNRVVAAALAAILLSACQTQQVDEMSYADQGKLAAAIEKRCTDQGYPRGSAQFVPCIKHEVNREVAIRQNAQADAERSRLAFASGMSAMGQGMQQSAATYRPVNCTSTPTSTWVGGPVRQVNTTCY